MDNPRYWFLDNRPTKAWTKGGLVCCVPAAADTRSEADFYLDEGDAQKVNEISVDGTRHCPDGMAEQSHHTETSSYNLCFYDLVASHASGLEMIGR
jgi:hypothetical protein